MNEHLFQDNILETRVCLLPEELDKNYQDLLLQKVKLQFEKTCIKNIGYIDTVININEYIHEEIMKMVPDVFFLLKVKVKSFIPKIGDQVKMNVDFVFNHGVFGGFEKIKILIPIQVCENDWKLQQDFSGLFLSNKINPKLNIKKGAEVLVELNKIRFEKDNFSCLAKIC
jgi:DNA-directed RNA polymerase subunit E'/Rpb7